MKKGRFIFPAVFLILAASLSAQVRDLAVLAFDVPGDEVLGNSLAEIAIGLFSEHTDVSLIDRRGLGKIMDEQKIRLSGLTAEDSGGVPELAEARFLGIGYVDYINRGTLSVSFRIVETDTGGIVYSGSITVNEKNEIIDGVRYLVLSCINSLFGKSIMLPQLEFSTSFVKERYLTVLTGIGAAFPVHFPTLKEDGTMTVNRIWQPSTVASLEVVSGRTEGGTDRQMVLQLRYGIREVVNDGDPGHDVYPLNPGVHYEGNPLDVRAALSFRKVRPVYHDGYSRVFRLYPQVSLGYVRLEEVNINSGPEGISFHDMNLGLHLVSLFSFNAYVSRVLEFEAGITADLELLRTGYAFSDWEDYKPLVYLSLCNQITASGRLGLRFRY